MGASRYLEVSVLISTSTALHSLTMNTEGEMPRHIATSSIERLLKRPRGLKQRRSSKRRRMPEGADARSANANDRWTLVILMIGVGWSFSTQNQWN
jgi:hypothetical protein